MSSNLTNAKAHVALLMDAESSRGLGFLDRHALRVVIDHLAALEADNARLRAALSDICDNVPDVSTLRQWIHAYDTAGPEAIANARELLQELEAARAAKGGQGNGN